MAVVDIPIGNLDNESDLMDWLAVELVTNHRFVEKRRTGTVAANNLIVMLERPQAETYHNDSPMLLLLEKGVNTESAVDKSFSFNLSPMLYTAAVETTTPQSITVNIDISNLADQFLDITAGAFTNWTSAGYTNGEFIRISNAATSGNNGLYEITSRQNGTSTDSRLNIREVANGGIKDFVAGATADVITVVEERGPLSSALGFVNTPINETIKWNCAVAPMASVAPYLTGRLITNPTSNSATPSEPLNFIVIIQTDLGIYRQFSFGEVVKLVPFDGGLYLSGSYFDASLDNDNNHIHWLQGSAASNYTNSSNANNAPLAVYSSDWTGAGVTNAEGRGWLLSGAYGGSTLGDAPTHYPMMVLPHYLGNGKELFGYSPSGFSGQSERWPITLFGGFGNKQYTLTTVATVGPMAVIPDIFLADITNVDAYSVFQDDYGEKFLVVPMYTKSGSGVGSTEKWGYLIRNPSLVVT